MATMDIFNSDAFSMLSLTDAINKIEYVPRRISSSGLFTERGVSTTTVMLEERNGYLALLPTSPRGAPATQKEKLKRKARALQVPHITLEATILASEIQNIREFGSENEMVGVQSVVDQHLTDMSESFDATLEWHMLGAIKGEVLDADGSTIYNMFDEFEVTQPTGVTFTWATDNIRVKCHEIWRTIEDNLGGQPITGVNAYVGKDFLDGLVSASEVQTAYERQGSNPEVGRFLRDRLARRQVIYAGITFEEYRGTVSGQQFVADDTAYFYPTGVPRLFQVYYAPADTFAAANTIGLPRYAMQARDRDFDRYVTLHAQSNPLAVCTRPGALITGTGV